MKEFKVKTYSGWLEIAPNIEIYYANLKVKNNVRVKNQNTNELNIYMSGYLPDEVKTELINNGISPNNLNNEIKIKLEV